MSNSQADTERTLQDCLRHSAFINMLGVKLSQWKTGFCEVSLDISPKLLQHTGVVHAGVLSTILDNTAGMAALTLLPQDQTTLTLEFKVNLLRPASEGQLYCRAEVIKSGRRFSIVESRVFAIKGESRSLVATATVTIVNQSIKTD